MKLGRAPTTHAKQQCSPWASDGVIYIPLIAKCFACLGGGEHSRIIRPCCTPSVGKKSAGDAG